MGHVYLIGFMGAGKSTVGRRVASRVGRPFVDLDDLIERREGATIAQIFAAEGEDAFRTLETEALQSMTSEPSAVVACGGGIVVADRNRTILRETGVTVYLKVEAAEALGRISDKSTRPLLSGPTGESAAASLLAAREALYTTASDITVDTASMGIEEVVEAVLRAIAKGEGA